MSEFKSNRQELLPAARHASVNYLTQGPRPSDEDRAWTKVYDSVEREPATAREVVKQLESDPEIKQSRLALLILAKQTVRRHEAEEAHRQRVAALARRTLVAVVSAPLRLFSSGTTFAMNIADPQAKKEPAKTRALSLKRDADFAAAKERFDRSATDESLATHSDSADSARTKAA